MTGSVHIATFGLKSGSLGDLVTLVEGPGGLVEVLRAAEGFGWYGLVDLGDGTVGSVSVWESEAAAEAVSGVVRDWMEVNVAERLEWRSLDVGALVLETRGEWLDRWS